VRKKIEILRESVMKEWLDSGYWLEYVTNTTVFNYRWHQRQLTAAGLQNGHWRVFGNFHVSIWRFWSQNNN